MNDDCSSFLSAELDKISNIVFLKKTAKITICHKTRKIINTWNGGRDLGLCAFLSR